MRVAVVFLVALGLLAAVCAAVLVGTLSKSPSAPPPTKADERVDLLVAVRDLPAMSLVDSSAVRVEKVAKAEVPEQALTNPVQVVGRVLTCNVVSGQPFTPGAFARKTEGVYLAAALPPGKRAVSVSLADWSCMAGLLYPGSVVDVIVSFKPLDAATETVSTTLLQGVQVLAVGAQSVAADQYRDKDPGALATRGQINARMVTLLVDPKQAEILQLATQNGSIALTMRNPLDTEQQGRRMTLARELGLYGGQSAPAPALSALANWLIPKPKAQRTSEPANQAVAGTQQRAARGGSPAAAAAAVRALWETQIVRGAAVEKRTFPMSEVEAAPAVSGGLAKDGDDPRSPQTAVHHSEDVP
jgi:pilus assembly protein CpaB